MDGVLWKDNTPIIDLPRAFKEIESLGCLALLATNNSMLSRQDYVIKLQNFGVNISEKQIYNSGYATAAYLKRRFPSGGSVFVVGEPGLVKSMEAAGFSVGERNAVAVVVGIDRHITYNKINTAMRLVRAGSVFIGTNPDKTFPTPDGIAPGAGSIIAAVETACEKEPVIIGKPSPIIFEMAIREHNLLPHETLMVGDRLDTDILGGQRAGCKTALVLSGITCAEDIHNWQPQPDIISDNLQSLLELLSTWKR